MMDRIWWYLCRATGVVATLLAVASLLWGFLFSARDTGRRRTAAWWLDLHNYLGGLALVFTGAHLVASVLDPTSGIGVVEVLVPGTATASTWAVTWGVLAAYVFAVTVLTSWPRRRFSRRVWRIVHLVSVAGVALGGLHGFLIGTDSATLAFSIGLVLCGAILVYAVSIRLFGAMARRRS